MDMQNFGIEETMGTVLTGFAVVFLALIILVVIIWCIGKVMDSMTSRKSAASSAPAEKPAPAPKAPAPKIVEVASDGLSDEVVTAITAAITAILDEEGDGKSYVVRSIKRVRKNRRAWGKAGVEENTRPF